MHAEKELDIQSEWMFVAFMAHLLTQGRKLGSKASLYQLHYPHPSQQLQEIFSPLPDISFSFAYVYYIKSLGQA